MVETVPQNVPQRDANQATHARYAAHARTFFLSDFVSIENKGSKIQIPKLDVAGSIPVARSMFLRKIAESNFEMKLMRGLAAENSKGIVVLIP